MKTSVVHMFTLTFVAFTTVFFESQACAAEECIDYLYGIGIPKDEKAAYECFSKKQDVDFQILMLLDGIGAAKDSQRAYELWKESNVQGYSAWSEYLEREIEQRINAPEQNFSMIDVCDAEYSNCDIDYCELLNDRRLKIARDAKISELEKKLSPNQVKLLRKINEFVGVIQTNDAEHLANMYFEGTGAGRVGKMKGDYITERHMKRVQLFLEQKTIPKCTTDELTKLDQDLNKLYRKQKRDIRKSIGEGASFSSPEVVRQVTAEALRTHKEAQRGWVRYSMTWVKLLQSIHNDRPPEEIDRCVRAKLIGERIEELKYDPNAED